MLRIINSKFRRLCSRLRWTIHRRSKPKIVIKKFGKSSFKSHPEPKHEPTTNGSASVHPNGQLGVSNAEKPIRIATFNAALFSMAPAIPKSSEMSTSFDEDVATVKRSIEVDLRAKSANDRPRSILKQSPLHPNLMNTPEIPSRQQFAKSKLRVSINLPDNEISLLRNRQLSFVEDENEGSSSNITSRSLRGKAPMRSNVSFSAASMVNGVVDGERYRSSRTVLEVLRELDADILALQDVKAEEEKGMSPLSDLATALGMNYVFAESWAPEYGNAIFSKWPIKRWKVQKIFDDTDFRFLLFPSPICISLKSQLILCFPLF